MTYVFSHGYSIRSGFPHSDIFGSKLVCQLPEALRRLPRPSSPVIAKASTTCTCSLDPITSVSHPPCGQFNTSLQVEYSRCAVFQSNLSITFSYIDTITTLIHLLTPISRCFQSISLLLLPDC